MVTKSRGVARRVGGKELAPARRAERTGGATTEDGSPTPPAHVLTGQPVHVVAITHLDWGISVRCAPYVKPRENM